MNKHVMENATTGQQRQFLLGSPPLKWPLVPKPPSKTRIDKPPKVLLLLGQTCISNLI